MTMPESIQLGPVVLHFYGLLIGLGVMVGWWVAEKMATKEGIEKKHMEQALVWLVLGGVVGARWYHVIDEWDYYGVNWWEIGQVWRGGLGIYGAVAGGVLGLVGYARVRKLAILKLLDLAAVGMPLGQAIGRWGNWVNHELYGLPTSLPWGLYVEPEYRLVGWEKVAYYHPLFIYESLGSAILFLILYDWWRSGRVMVGGGKLFGGYLIGYGVLRWWLEGLRPEPWTMGGIPVARWVSLVAIIVGGMMWGYADRHKKRTG